MIILASLDTLGHLLLMMRIIVFILYALLLIVLLLICLQVVLFSLSTWDIKDEKNSRRIKKSVIRLEKLVILFCFLSVPYLFFGVMIGDFVLLGIPVIIFSVLGIFLLLIIIFGAHLLLLEKMAMKLPAEAEEEYKIITNNVGKGTLSKTNEILPNFLKFLKSIIT